MSGERRKVEWSLDLEHLRVRAGQLVSDAMGGAAEAKRASLGEPLDKAASAQIKIAFPVGPASIKALEPGSPNLFEAELTYVGEIEFDVSGGAERVISLRRKGSSVGEFGPVARDLRWDIALARNLPIQLGITAGVGEADIDLDGLQIDALQLETGVGKALVTLPAQESPLRAKFRGGVGLTELRIPKGAYGELDITGGLGSVNIAVSPGTAARVEAKPGLGVIDLPERFMRVSGEKSAKSRRNWQTADYANADRKLTIRYTGGMGRFQLDTAD